MSTNTSTPAPDLVAIGECMVELSRHGGSSMALGYGGDTFNTCVYAARLGLDVAYATALGDDPYSQGIVDLAASEGIAMADVPRLPGRLPGLYAIETDDKGERRFFYWRDRAPARELFELPESARLIARIEAAKIVYFSGITLSLYAPAGLDRFDTVLKTARANGATIAFDGNFRPRGWPGGPAQARETFARFLPHVGLMLPTFDDEQALWADATPQNTLERLARHGIGEIVVKDGSNGAFIRSGGNVLHVPVPEKVTPVDTTAAGDSFNAGYLAGRFQGGSEGDAALAGHRLAGKVIGYRGAIVPRGEMAEV